MAERTAKVCTLAPGAVADFGVVERLAQVAVTGTEQHSYYHYFVLAKGLTEDRAGRHAEAVQWLERFAPKADRGYDFDAIAFAALAMAQHRLGRTDEAKESLAKAQAIVARNIPDRSEGRPFRAGNWHDWLHAEILVREAEGLVGVISAQELASTTSEMRALDLNNSAWSLATSADPQTRDPHTAVELAQEAVKLAPNTADFWNTLGVAQYRDGNFKEAVSALQKYRELRTGDAEWTNPFFLAMAHWQLGNKEEARQWFDKGAQWMDGKNAKSEAMVRFRHEAAELLGVNEKK
jgi:Flp pilus assembly protein TadD